MEKIKDYLSGGIELPILGLPNGNPSTIDDRRLLGFLQGESELLFQDVDSVATEERLRADSSNFNEDGHHLAPNGEPSNLTYEQWVTVRTPSFLAWFGDWMNDPDNASKVVDENGEPLVVYHGSFADFSVFDRTKTRANMDIQGNFFSPWAEDSEGYGPNVRAFFLNLRNPAGFRDGYKALNTFKGQDNAGVKARELLASRGFDGVNNDGEEYIAFEPNQIKSVDNRGTFDESNPDIYFQDAPDDYQPEKTGIGYKVFYLHDGKLYPPMVANSGGVDTPVERWLLAESGEIAGYTKTGRPQVRAGGKGTNASKQMLAYRPGWHLGEIPYALQFSKTNPLTGERGQLFPADFVWAEVEFPMDVDYQEEAMSYGYNEAGNFQHSLAGLPRLPENGFYRYRTNPNPQTDPWIITGAMRVNRILSRAEVDALVRAAGRTPQLNEADFFQYLSPRRQRELQKIIGAQAENALFMQDDRADVSDLTPEQQEKHQRIAEADEAYQNSQLPANGNESLETVYASNAKEAESHLRELQGTEIVNRNDGSSARISSTTIGKLLSNKALNKSLANGFTRAEHDTAAANIDVLFRNAIRVDSRADRRNSPDIRAIHTYETAVEFDGTGRDGIAEILVKESIQNGQLIYTLELAELKFRDPSASRLGDSAEEPARSQGLSIVKLSSNSSGVNYQDSLDDFYDGYDSDMDSIETPEDAEVLARIYSDYDASLNEATSGIVDSMADENIPEYDPDAVNLKSDGTEAASMSDYEADVAENVIPSKTDMDAATISLAGEYTGQMSVAIPNNQADKLLGYLQESPEQYIPSEFSERNWKEQFGDNPVIDTPAIGSVKISENQYKKLIAKGRADSVGMLKPTLERPSLIIEETRNSDNGANAYEIIKVFQTDDGRKWYYVAAVDKDGMLVAQSCRPSYYNQIRNRLKKFPLAYVAADNQQAVDLVQHLRDATGLNHNVSGGYESVNEGMKLVTGVSDSNLRWKGFIEQNRPDIDYTGDGKLSEEQKDDIFVSAIQNDATLTKYLGIIGEALYMGTDYIPVDIFIDQVQRERKKARIFDTITSAPVRNAAGQAVTGSGIIAPPLLVRARRAIASNARFYRNQLAFLMDDDAMRPANLMPEPRGLALPKREDMDRLSVGNLRKLAVTASDMELVEQVRRGTLSADATQDKADIRRLGDSLKEMASAIERLHKALLSADLRTEEARERAKRQITELKAKQRELQRQKRLREEIRDRKQKLANSIMRPVNLRTTDYDTSAEAIWAIQSMIDPHFRRDWAYDLESNPNGEAGGATMTIDEARAYLGSLSEEGRDAVLSALSPALVDRLLERTRPLNDMTIAELESLAQEVELLRRQGREVLAAKKAFERAAADAVIKAVINAVASRADSRDDEPYGSVAHLRRGKTAGDILWAAGNATFRMDENSQLLDGGFGNMGAARQFLIDEERYHRHRQMRAVDARTEPIEALLGERKDVLDKLYSKHEFIYGDFRGEYTVDEFMYGYLSQFNEETRAAVAYGNFLRQREKGTARAGFRFTKDGSTVIEYLVENRGVVADDDQLRKLGDGRYEAFVSLAEEKIREAGLWDVMKAIEADFNNASNRERLQRAVIAFFNNPVAFVKYYLPIIRVDIKGNDFLNDFADSAYNLNTGMKEYSVEKGFTLERVRNISPRHQKPVNMSLMSVWQQSVENQEYLIEYGGYIKKARMIFGNAELQDAVNKAYGLGLMSEVNTFINLVANPHAMRDGSNENINRFIRTARGRLTTAYLAYKSSTIVMQMATSAWPFIRDMKKGYLASAFLQLASQRHRLLDMIYSKSVMMKHRSSDMIMQEAMDRRRSITSRAAMTRLRKMEDLGMRGIELVDRYMVAAGWYGKYMEEMAIGESNGLTTEQAEARAVKAADDLVYAVQPSGAPRDLPSLFRNKNELVRAFLQFQSALSVIWNNVLPDNIGYFKTKQWGMLFGGTFAYMMAGLTLGLIADGFDDDDDAKDRIRKMVYWMLTQPIESIPFLGSEISNAIQKLMTGKSEFYGSGTVLMPAVAKVIGGSRKVLEGNAGGLLDIGESMALLTGLPVSGAKQLYRAMAEGNPGILLGR